METSRALNVVPGGLVARGAPAYDRRRRSNGSESLPNPEATQDLALEEESTMPGRRHSTSRSGGKATKNPRQYKALRRRGLSKARAAKITNAGKKASRLGGRRSHKGSRYR
jgi:hypothetical protein